MLLQKMKYDKKIVICIVNEIEHGGEYTICGNVNFSAGCGEDDGFEPIGEHFNGKLQNVSCPECKKHVGYVKTFE